jgi:hypothetical protein
MQLVLPLQRMEMIVIMLWMMKFSCSLTKLRPFWIILRFIHLLLLVFLVSLLILLPSFLLLLLLLSHWLTALLLFPVLLFLVLLLPFLLLVPILLHPVHIPRVAQVELVSFLLLLSPLILLLVRITLLLLMSLLSLLILPVWPLPWPHNHLPLLAHLWLALPCLARSFLVSLPLCLNVNDVHLNPILTFLRHFGSCLP